MQPNIDAVGQRVNVEVPLPGTQFSLHHDSKRVPSYAENARVDIPLINGEPPAGIQTVKLEIEVAGNVVFEEFDPEPDLSYEFSWDGEDAYGRQVAGSYPIDYEIGYVYRQSYVIPDGVELTEDDASMFAVPPGEISEYEEGDTIPGRETTTLWRQYSGKATGAVASVIDSRIVGQGGWQFDVRHDFDPVADVIRYGDGTTRSLPSRSRESRGVVQPAAGLPPDGALTRAQACDVGPDGSVYVADLFYIRRLLPSGEMQTVAGTVEGADVDSIAGEEPLSVELFSPRDVAVDSSGRLVFAEGDYRNVYRIDEGIITLMPRGSDIPDRSEDRRTGENLRVTALATGSEDAIYVARGSARRTAVVQRIDTNGATELVAGTGVEASDTEPEYPLEGEPLEATEVTLGSITGMAANNEGQVYLADIRHRVVMRVDRDGTIRTVAGTGSDGYSGDGGPATAADLRGRSQFDVDVDGEGGFYVTDDFGNVVRRVDDSGTIRTVVGDGDRAYDGNGGPALEASFVRPSALASDANGGLYIADNLTSSVRYLTAEGTVEYAMGTTREMYERLEELDTVGPEFLYVGDGGPATRASIGEPLGVAVGPDDGFYVADRKHHVVREVSPDGTISTLAGSGTKGYSGDGGMADRANLDRPDDLAAASDGSVYIADTGNEVVRHVRPDGTITTVAENIQGLEFSPPLTLDEDDNLYVADDDRGVLRVDATGNVATVLSDDGGRISDGMDTENIGATRFQDIVHDGDDGLYVSEAEQGDRIFHVEFGGTATLVAGKEEVENAETSWVDGVELESANYLALAPDGTLVAGEKRGANRLVEVATDGSVSVLLDSAEDLELTVPFRGISGIATDSVGDIYVSDSALGSVRKIRRGKAAVVGTNLIPTADGNRLFEFDEGNRHVRTYDALTGEEVFTFDYDDDSNLTTITDASGNETTVEREDDGTPSAVVTPNGKRYDLSLDGDGWVETITNPAGDEYGFANDGGQLTEIIDADGATTTFRYNDLGRLQARTTPMGDTSTFSRTSSDDTHEISVETGAGRTRRYSLTTGESGFSLTNQNTGFERTIETDGVEYEYPGSATVSASTSTDPRFGMRAPVISALTTTTSKDLTKDLSGTRTVTLSDQEDPLSVSTLTTTVTVDGRTKSERYADADRTLTTTFPTGRSVTEGVGTAGRRTTRDRSGRETIEYEYDDDGRLTTRRHTTGSETREWTTSFDDDGVRESATDPRGESLTFEADDLARLVGLTLPDGSSVDLERDPTGRVQRLTPPGKPAHEMTYDDNGNLVTYSQPGGSGSWGYEYDADDMLQRITFPSETVVAYSYDDERRLTTKSLPEGTVDFSYENSTGALTEVEGPNGSTLSRNLDGTLPVTETLQGEVSGTITRRFDSSFRPTTVTIEDNSVTYEYDGDSQVTRAGSCSISRDSAGLVSEVTVASVTRDWDRNGFGEVSTHETTVGGSSAYRVDYERNERGWVTKTTETVDGATTTREFSYDARGRLTEVSEDGSVVESYGYDDNNNRTTTERDGRTENHSYDGSDRLESSGDREYTYDDEGRLTEVVDTTAGDTTSYQYDSRGTLTAASLPDGTDISYVLGPMGRRVGKRVDGTLERGWLYHDALRPAAELDGSGTVRARFVYGSSNVTPDYMEKDGTTYAFVRDHRDSPRLIVNADTGDVAQRLEYDAFGRVTEDTNPGFQPFGFAGGLYDPETGLVRFGRREYDPEFGRFTRPDPAAFAGGYTNLYVYAGNDPVNGSDETGLFGSPPEVVGGAILDGGIEAGSQYMQHGEIRDWGKVATSAATGAATGALGPAGGALAKTVKGKIAAEAAVDAGAAAGATAGRNAANDCAGVLDGVLTAAATAFGFGAAGGAGKSAAGAGTAGSDLPSTTDLAVDTATKTGNKATGSALDSGDGGDDSGWLW